MSFEEKSSWVMLIVITVVYGWYFTSVVGDLSAGTVVTDITYKGAMIGTVVAVIVLAIGGHISITVAARGDSSSDERDREINRQGEYIGGFVLGTGALVALALAMLEKDHFWIANTILLTLVLSEMTSGVVKILIYRRGF